MKWPLPTILPLVLSLLILTETGCQNSSSTEESIPEQEAPLFTALPAEKTGVDFQNTLTEGLNTNVLIYQYFYNGGGVAVGDVNGDGFDDLYFTGNMTANKLYLNKGANAATRMQFADITDAAGVAGREGPWKTGVTMADVNGDGRLDIYICYSGKLTPEKRENQLFINEGADAKGIPHFSEQAKKYGLASPANSTQATFFDYDKDGDLDMFLLNHNPKSLPILDEASTADLLKKEDAESGVRLFRNDKEPNGAMFFRDVTQKAGLSSSALTYGLGAGIADINGDGWPDIYVANDYAVPDYLYINRKNGTFSDRLKTSLGHTSHFSMGTEVADVNNDALPDIFTLDMLPEDNRRQKLLFAPDNYEKFDLNIKSGFHHQYMRNMLQLNAGNNAQGEPNFSEVGQLAGISNTDWSWAPLFADYDNDGWKDLFVTNGFLRDYTNMDFIKYMGDFLQNRQVMRQDLLEMVYKIPSSDVSNYVFKNNGGQSGGNAVFSNVSKSWGVAQAANSNGAAYADLDNDGDLDLIVNNINKPAFIYQNEADKALKNDYLKVKLEGLGQNTQGVGAKVTLYSKGKPQYLEQMPTRGYQSSVSPILHFGLGKKVTIDSLRVVWPSGKQQVLRGVKANQLLIVQEKLATDAYRNPKEVAPLFREVASPIIFQSLKTTTNDFKRQPLMINPLSFSGPCLVKADVNGDGLEDVYVGGGSGKAGMIYVQQKEGNFMARTQPDFERDKESEDTDAVFFDANGDGAADLYVCSGGYGNFLPDDVRLQDRLYINDGKGSFTKKVDALPPMRVSKSCVRVADVNGDGRPDLFVGGRVVPGRYPETPPSFLLVNDGKGVFKDQIANLAPELQRMGMVSDAAWVDLNGDKKPELVVVGEWMPVTVWANTNGKWANKTTDYFAKEYRGWWNKLLVDDFNGDGKPDLVIGNLGLNTQCKASDKEPAEMYYKDFDDNGSVDPIFCFYMQGKSYPYVTRDELLDQMSIMRTRFPDYKSYADATLKEIFSAEELEGAARLEANYLKTAYFEQNNNGRFDEKTLPTEVQVAPVYALSSLDYDQDGKKDLLVCGNVNRGRLRFGKYDANFGVLLKGNGKGGFVPVPQQQSGFQLTGDVRSILPVGNTLLFGINQGAVRAYQVKK
ncbi:VCBS repeat-containing protein [Tellurirhabdus bombi]|uniref:VCBS repeat-containing protein n=1 Tax=Tellurirhabdus bombi TaxID=2907205 RepID=UPI001F47554B|nr:VCBS repeat-containing protein [Tellurirhabdus bombi]